VFYDPVLNIIDLTVYLMIVNGVDLNDCIIVVINVLQTEFEFKPV
jgi:hypothetical protein